MPTTLTGILLFVALLIPGFVFVTIAQREKPQRRLTAFQETSAVVLVSVVSDIVALTIFILLHTFRLASSFDMRGFVRDPGSYFVTKYGVVFFWGIGLLAIACGIAAVGGWIYGRRPAHPSTMSSWWTLFDRWHPTHIRFVQVILDDGTLITGQLGDWNTTADDLPDRDLILGGKITYRAPGVTTEPVDHPASFVCISARRIVTMFVTYSDPATSAAQEAEVAAEEAAPSVQEQASVPDAHPGSKA